MLLSSTLLMIYIASVHVLRAGCSTLRRSLRDLHTAPSLEHSFLHRPPPAVLTAAPHVIPHAESKGALRFAYHGLYASRGRKLSFSRSQSQGHCHFSILGICSEWLQCWSSLVHPTGLSAKCWQKC